jgi:acyl carrier protein
MRDPEIVQNPQIPQPSATGAYEATVIELLAHILFLEPGQVDPEMDFQALGLDSILAVEFTAAVAKRTGFRIQAASVYEHPSARDFAAFLASGSAPGQSH